MRAWWFVTWAVSCGAGVGCQPATAESVQRAQPEPRSASAVSSPSARAALATPDSGSGYIHLVIPDREARCGPLEELPRNCEPAWRIRIDLSPEAQRPGRYPLSSDSPIFSYRDAQGKSQAGAWVQGQNCENLSGHVNGSLEIISIDADSILGVLQGAGVADGPFRALRCPACLGVGMDCQSDAQCCNNLCGRTCKP
jgi:hypothetical protein